MAINPVIPRFGFQAARGTDYTSGQEPEIAADINRMGQALHRLFTGISGARTPAHSVAVGGFADDPHTRGEASDTQGAQNVPESTLEKYGLTRPFPGASEADHLQLLGGNTATTKGTVTPRPRGRAGTPADWLKQAGWPSNLIPIMVAIGGAESSWRVNAVSPPNTNGTVDRGWLQINSSHSQYDPQKLTSDPVYTARAAYQIYKEQGLAAWSTYTNGAYKSFLGVTPGNTSSTGAAGRTRPGGESSSGGDDVDNELVSFWGTLGQGATGALGGVVPGLIAPLKLFSSAGQAIHSGTDFLKWIAWIFHPLNILRVVEFMVGFPLMIFGLWTFIQVWRDSDGETPVSILADKGSKSTSTPVSQKPPKAQVKIVPVPL